MVVVCALGRGQHRTGMDTNDVPQRPVADDDLEAFAGAFTAGLDGLDDKYTVTLVVAAHRADGGLDVVFLDPVRADTADALGQLTSRRRRILGMASRVAWSPTREGASSPAWLGVVVGVGSPLVGAVRRDQDPGWWRLPQAHLPWGALATAAGLRAAVERGEPLRLKVGSDAGLLRRPDEAGDPPVDEHGNL